ncbi:MAG: phosphodiester glycosidase family protein, partial [Eisenbergiella sp.]
MDRSIRQWWTVRERILIRTVIGITAEGKVEILCVNKPGANFSSELTSGTTFREITDYMMNELGCVDVLNMDGGGSTEMTARRAGADSLATVSYPSDGGSRLVSNSLLIISNAPRTTEVAQVLVDKDVNLYPGSETDFSVRLTDASGSSLDASGYQVVWSAQYGTIDENGHYTAPTEERDDVVTAEVAGVSGTARVSVIGADHVQSISISGGDSLALD